MNHQKNIVPFLKWAGGKRWLAHNYSHLFPAEYNHYIEPFLGSGAIFFFLKPPKSILSDLNKELINAYRAIRDDSEGVKNKLIEHQKYHSNEYYYYIREQLYDDPISRAARLLYLNRTCWNGLYRVNLNGKFNVPIGTKRTIFYDTDDFEGISSLLQRVVLLDFDFEETISLAHKDDFVFIDPPYTVMHNSNNFRKYNQHIFSWDDQIRLRDSVYAARDRGAKIVLCNADNEAVKDLYKDFGTILHVNRASLLAADSKKRQKISEIVISSEQY